MVEAAGLDETVDGLQESAFYLQDLAAAGCYVPLHNVEYLPLRR